MELNTGFIVILILVLSCSFFGGSAELNGRTTGNTVIVEEQPVDSKALVIEDETEEKVEEENIMQGGFGG